MMKKCILLILAIVLAVSFTGCGKKKTSKNTSSVFHNDEFPSFVVEDTTASAGEKDAVVLVKVKDNPGFLTMAMNIEYDSSVMVLTDVKKGKDYEEYNFIGPKNKISGCTASWFIPEVPEKTGDGTLAELHFSVLSKAKSGKYPITISRPDNGGIVDRNQTVLVFNNAVGYITIQ